MRRGVKARVLVAAGVCLLLGGAVFGQNVLSSQAGFVYYWEGEAAVAGPTRTPGDVNTQLRVDEQLQVRKGWAEVLVTPGAMLRMSEGSALRMKNTSLEAAEFALEAGAAMLEVGRMPTGNTVRMWAGDSEVQVRQNGLYRIDVVAGELRVYGGGAVVKLVGGREVAVKRGLALRMTDTEALPVPFDTLQQDGLHAWSGRRSLSYALENLAAYHKQKRWRYVAQQMFYSPDYDMKLYSNRIPEYRLGEGPARSPLSGRRSPF